MFAFDRDPQRVKILQTMVDRSGATCITVQCRDFLKVDPNDPLYAGVEYILVDPSCSGSGNVDRFVSPFHIPFNYGGGGEGICLVRLSPP